MTVRSIQLLTMALALATPHSDVLADPVQESPPVNQFGLSRPLPRQPGTVRLATYNVLNLFDHVDDPALGGEFDDLPMATSPDRCRNIAAAILAIDADVLAMQEVESLEALRWFRDTYLPDAGYDHLASFDVGYFRGVECSVMSRHKITDARIWPQLSLDDVRRTGPGWEPLPPEVREGLSFRRSPLVAEIDIDGRYRLTVVSLHHKSGRDHRHYREAEALKVLQLLGELEESDPSRNIVVMGDFNAAPWDKSLRAYLQSGYVDTLAHRIIPRWRNASQDEARLYKTHESDRVIDYILLNSAALREYVVGSAHVHGTLMPPEGYDWRTDPYPAGYASDHYPVIVDLVPRDRE